MRHESITVHVEDLAENRLESTSSWETTYINLRFNLLQNLSCLFIVNGPIEASFGAGGLSNLILI